jgi:hypothetical protein
MVLFDQYLLIEMMQVELPMVQMLPYGPVQLNQLDQNEDRLVNHH